jgi:hypothetical protein
LPSDSHTDAGWSVRFLRGGATHFSIYDSRASGGLLYVISSKARIEKLAIQEIGANDN